MNFTRLQVIEKKKNVELSCLINGNKCFYLVPIKYKNYVTKTYDAFLLALILRAIKDKKNMTFDGPLSEKLYYNMVHKIAKILAISLNTNFIPKIKYGRLINEKYESANFVTTGISCGVDSLCCVQENYFNNACPPSFKLNCLLYFQSAEIRAKTYRVRIAHSQKFSNEINLPMIGISSNVAKFSKFPHVKVHTMINCSFVLVLQKLISKFFYSSSTTYENTAIKGCEGPSRMEPLLVSLFSTESTEISTQGQEFTRVQKTVKISNNPLSNKYLNVCTNQNFITKYDYMKNCGGCDKCLRTLLTLDIAGKLNDYKNIFDLPTYHNKIPIFINRMFRDNEYLKEIVDYGIKNNFKPIVEAKRRKVSARKATPRRVISKKAKLETVSRKTVAPRRVIPKNSVSRKVVPKKPIRKIIC